ncbi:MAG: hypothetical protein J7J91_03140, partial [Deltaproteobacteria bacterium]|nr:hypothetical protein [Deltaproteobacteria bacterium]
QGSSYGSLANLVRFAHNWNAGILEQWNNGHQRIFVLSIIPIFHHPLIEAAIAQINIYNLNGL